MRTLRQYDWLTPELFGRFVLLERLARGGMAEVFRARDLRAVEEGHYLAIKRILPHYAGDADFVAMFADEASITVQLNHPNICQLYELARMNGTYYIVMEFLAGQDLLACQNRFRKARSVMEPAQAAYITSKLCRGLHYAHTKADADGKPLNIIHRDISPQNVLVTYDGAVKVIDFGIARARDRRQKTEAGVLKGKFGYMSPEQVRGKWLTGQSDVFAAGVLMWELLTNRRLFYSKVSSETLERVLDAPIPPPSNVVPTVPGDLDQIVLRALERSTKRRYASAAEFADTLERWLNTRRGGYRKSDLSDWTVRAFAKQIETEVEHRAAAEQIRSEQDVFEYQELYGIPDYDGDKRSRRKLSKADFENYRSSVIQSRDPNDEVIATNTEVTGDHGSGPPRYRFAPDYLLNQRFSQIPGLSRLDSRSGELPEKQRSKTVKFAVAGAAVAVAAAGAVLLSSGAGTPVSLVVEPSVAQLTIDDTPVEYESDGEYRVRLAEGTHTVRATAEGYRGAVRTFDVDKDSEGLLRLTLAALGTVSSRVVLARGQHAWLDGDEEHLSGGIRQIEFEPREGRTLYVAADGYDTRAYSLDDTFPEVLEPELVRIETTLEIRTNIPAEVTVDGEPVGSTSQGPVLVHDLARLDTHDVTLRATSPGFLPVDVSFAFAGTWNRTQTWTLPRIGQSPPDSLPPGTLRILAGAGATPAAIHINERDLGEVVGDSTEPVDVALPQGIFTLQLVRGSEVRSVQVEIESGDTTEISLPLTQRVNASDESDHED